MLTYFLAGIISLLIVLFISPVIIPLLHRLKFGQTEREEGPQSHKVKQGTPTMGGLIFIVAILLTSIIFTLDKITYVLPTILAMFGFGLIGFLDDFIKVTMSRNLGLRAYQKFSAQFILAFVFAYWAYKAPFIGSSLYLPISGKSWDLGFWYIPLAMFVILACTNACNLIDGLDGLCSSVTLIYNISMIVVFLILARQAQVATEVVYSSYLDGMAIMGFSVLGGLLGFLWFNSYPAQIFMGDTGSLALGGIVAMYAICSRSILLLPIMGICLVATTMSVIIQVSYFKITHGKRVFRMAPLHHHFELGGMHETKIVTRYSIVTVIACAIGLLSYIIPRF